MEIKKNQILQTKDGRFLGNAIVTHFDSVDNIVYAKTDYGNEITMTLEEVDKFYYIPDMRQFWDIENHKHYTM